VILPEDIFKYFEIIKVDVDSKTLNVYLDELDIKPKEYEGEKLTSKGFHAAAVIQDFPIRERTVMLHVRRRRWLVESTGKVVSRDWNVVAEGTRYTKGFASFLKELFGQSPNQWQKS
jgi:hypothetical protein